MNLYEIICPYCSHKIKVLDYEEGYQAIVCTECDQPFLNHTKMVPEFQSYAVVGCSYGRIYKTSVEAPTLPTPKEIEEDAKYYKENAFVRAIKEDPEEILCVDCGKPADTGSPFQMCTDRVDEEFRCLPTNTRVSYRIDGEYVYLKYTGKSLVKTTLADIWTLLEESKETKNITPVIEQMLGDVNGITHKRASINAFVAAVRDGVIEI